MRAPIRRSTASTSWASAPATPRARHDLDKEFPGLPRYEGLTEALAGAQTRRGRGLRLYRTSRADGARSAGRGRTCVLRKAARRHARSRRERRRRGARSKQGAAGRLYPARPSVVDAVCRDRPHPRQAAGHAHEPQSAIVGLVLGRAQGADALDLADRRLRRPLCRRDVPGDAGEADRGACGRRAAHRRDRADDGQLRPSPSRLRRRFGRLVRGRLGSDDERDRVLREGHDRTERLRFDRGQG